MLALLPRLMLFLSSYMPLYAIVAYQYWDDTAVRYAVIALAAAGLVGLAIVAGFAKSTTKREVKVESVQRKDAEALAYLFTYVFPFLGTKFDQVGAAVPFGIIFLTIAVIYVSANLIHVNPVLNLLMRHVYEVQGEGQTFTVIVRKAHLYRGDTVKGTEIAHEVLWA